MSGLLAHANEDRFPFLYHRRDNEKTWLKHHGQRTDEVEAQRTTDTYSGGMFAVSRVIRMLDLSGRQLSSNSAMMRQQQNHVRQTFGRVA
jgi:hypothetical protein